MKKSYPELTLFSPRTSKQILPTQNEFEGGGTSLLFQERERERVLVTSSLSTFISFIYYLEKIVLSSLFTEELELSQQQYTNVKYLLLDQKKKNKYKK